MAKHADRLQPRRHVKKTADDYLDEIKKMVEEYERKFGKLPAPVPDPVENFPQLKGIGFHDYDEEPCAFRSFQQAHPEHTGPLLLYCGCRRCSPHCL